MRKRGLFILTLRFSPRFSFKSKQQLGLLRIFTKPRGRAVDLTDPIVVKKDATIEDVANAIHRSIASKFKYALVYGRSSRFNPAAHRVGLHHKVADEDVVALFTNT